jgi:GH25 family lysozyme M1 (1,4-beta-N-acetylmuramidase)
VLGIDISDAQGTINWTSVRAAGVRFAVMKATQGTYNTQHTFAANWSGARRAGVLRAAYHFFDPTQDGVAQANHFLAVMGTLEADDLPPVIDAECPNSDPNCLGWSGASGAAPASAIRTRLMGFLNTVESATGRRPMIYTSGAYFSGNGIDTTGLAAYPLWIAYPTTTNCYHYPSPWSHATMWQYSWTGRIAGIPGADVDEDRFLGTIDDLTAFASGGAPAPTPTPMPTPPPSGPNCSGLHDGLYCGNDHVGGTASTLYRCAAGAISVVEACPSGCQVNPAGVDDACIAMTPPPPPPPAPTDACAAYHDCATCTAQATCGWCNGGCATGTSSGPSAGSCGGDTWAWTSSQCSAPPPPPPPPSDPCAAFTDCASCTAQPACGFCDGECHSGTSTGPNSGSCTGVWAWYSSQC